MGGSVSFSPSKVSIHAPWEGCDGGTSSVISQRKRFNSRTLGRVRPLGGIAPLSPFPFQFTHPGKGATSTGAAASHLFGRFNSRTLGRVRRSIANRILRAIDSFNSRTLGRVRRGNVSVHTASIAVSIHAPWEGCDWGYHGIGKTYIVFQFTHPGKGAT